VDVLAVTISQWLSQHSQRAFGPKRRNVPMGDGSLLVLAATARSRAERRAR